MDNQSPFLQLPLELRNQVYTKMLPSQQFITLIFGNAWVFLYRASLFKINRQIRDEVSRILYSTKESGINIANDPMFRPEDVRTFVHGLEYTSIVAKEPIDTLTIHYHEGAACYDIENERLPLDRILPALRSMRNHREARNKNHIMVRWAFH